VEYAGVCSGEGQGSEGSVAVMGVVWWGAVLCCACLGVCPVCCAITHATVRTASSRRSRPPPSLSRLYRPASPLAITLTLASPPAPSAHPSPLQT